MTRVSIIHVASTALVGLSIVFASLPASAKTVKECDAEYKANKEAIKASGEKKKDFVTACRAGTETIPGGAAAAPRAAAPAAPPPSTATAPSGITKTAKECNEEYKANKAAIKARGEKKRDFVEACRSGAPEPSGGVPQAAPAQQSEPAAAPSAEPAPRARARRQEPAATATGAGEFSTDTAAKARCPSDTVVWVNTRSHIYHFAGTHNYGTTKHGDYMCEADAKSAGDRAAENEKHP